MQMREDVCFVLQNFCVQWMHNGRSHLYVSPYFIFHMKDFDETLKSKVKGTMQNLIFHNTIPIQTLF